ncbi:MAG: ATP-binding cassette domain-containing protein, partial [Polaromonas sp.]|nr:ATP-binding cassette domain-containing protein [Polaromonas sp.]
MQAPNGGNFVDFSDVWLAYNDELLAQKHFAVEAIDLKVREGEFIAIVGPSGCGKSTFMKLTTGLKMPSRGRILIDGQPVTGPLKISGMAFQAPSLLPWRTTVDNVLLPLEIVEPFRSQFKSRRKEFVERARKLLQKVGLGGYEDKFPWQLSGGMQ